MRWRSRSALAGEAADEASGAAVLHGARGAPPCVVPSSISLPSGENLTEEKSIGPPASGVNVANGPFSYARTSYILVWPPPPEAANTMPCRSKAMAARRPPAKRITPVQSVVRRSHSRTVSSAEAEAKVSSLGVISSATTRSVCPLKKRRYRLSCSER